jgi:hypothetical protein
MAMTTRARVRAATVAMSMLLACAWASARAQEIPLITGEHWTNSSVQLKKAYLVGLANAIQVEAAYAGANPASDGQSLVPRLVRGMKGHTLDGVRDRLDQWYSANPGKLDRPVVEIIWFELVVPGLKQQGG